MFFNNGIGYCIKTAIDSHEALVHEIGHAIDACNVNLLLDNDEIVEIYNAEWEIFKENNPGVIDKEMKYFSQKSPAKGLYMPKRTCYDDGGLREMVAEVNMLTKTYGMSPLISRRAKVLVRYFPNTIALIAKELEASTLI